MATQFSHGTTQDARFMFTKLLVHDIDQAAAFYSGVFGLIEVARFEAVITGRPVTEAVFQPSHDGGPMFILARFADSTAPAKSEMILGFATSDLDALVARAQKAGGKVVDRLEVPGAGTHIFIEDPEGHIVQASQQG